MYKIKYVKEIHLSREKKIPLKRCLISNRYILIKVSQIEI